MVFGTRGAPPVGRRAPSSPLRIAQAPQPHRLFSQLRIVQAPQQKDAALWKRSTGPIVHIKEKIGRSEGPSVQQLTYFVKGISRGFMRKNSAADRR